MSSKQSKQTTQTLKQNHQKFKKIEKQADDLRETVYRKIVKQINKLDAEEKKAAAKQAARKRALALKGQIRGQYTVDEPSTREVPVDGEIRAGTMVFMQRCSTCHTLEALDPRPQKGPPLGLIYNRRVGSNQEYQNYSMSMLKKSFFWSPLNLYRFMSNPQFLVPKTTCGLLKYPITSEPQRADLIAMFREFTAELSFNIRLKQIERVGYTAFQTYLKSEQQVRMMGEMRDERQQNIEQKI